MILLITSLKDKRFFLSSEGPYSVIELSSPQICSLIFFNLSLRWSNLTCRGDPDIELQRYPAFGTNIIYPAGLRYFWRCYFPIRHSGGYVIVPWSVFKILRYLKLWCRSVFTIERRQAPRATLGVRSHKSWAAGCGNLKGQVMRVGSSKNASMNAPRDW